MIDDRHRQFLLALGTQEVRHSGRTLYEHLCGTHELLEAWGNPEHVCNAGLFHSIYGTGNFKHQSWPLVKRVAIKELIGQESEGLVFIFCVSDRRKLFLKVVAPLGRALREIEAANLLEQGSNSSSYLVRLRDSDISDGAKHAIARHLKEAA